MDLPHRKGALPPTPSATVQSCGWREHRVRAEKVVLEGAESQALQKTRRKASLTPSSLRWGK